MKYNQDGTNEKRHWSHFLPIYLTEVTDEDASREEIINFIQKKLDERKI